MRPTRKVATVMPTDLAKVGKAATAASRGGRRYVNYEYVTDGCKRLTEDGECMRRSKRAVSAAVTVSLESQARTLEEQRRMDQGRKRVMVSHHSLERLLCSLESTVLNSEFPLISWDERSSLVEVSKSGPFP